MGDERDEPYTRVRPEDIVTAVKPAGLIDGVVTLASGGRWGVDQITTAANATQMLERSAQEGTGAVYVEDYVPRRKLILARRRG